MDSSEKAALLDAAVGVINGVVLKPSLVVPLDELVAKDIAALRQLPSMAFTNPNQVEADGRDGRLPIPSLWVECQWWVMPLIFTGDTRDKDGTVLRRFRCPLHRRDGSPCSAQLELPWLYQQPWRAPFPAEVSEPVPPYHPLIHLYDEHGIDMEVLEPPQRSWQYPLMTLDCCCEPVCLDFTLAPCCFAGRLCSMVDHGCDNRSTEETIPAYSDHAVGCCDSPRWCVALSLFIFCLSYSPLHHVTRQRVKWLHNIAEEDYVTCMKSWLCLPCSAIQVHRELSSAGIWAGYTFFKRDVPAPSAEDVRRRFNLLTREAIVSSAYRLPSTEVATGSCTAVPMS